jgi:prepilin-type N-terminal cleavage/methylation domain-containing protein/prepilin-type processing-associated H-X9-DG protein
MIRHNRHLGPANAFTLIELLVVISIIALLVSILLPSLAKAKDLARSSVCLNNLRNTGTAMSLYHAEHKQYFWPYSLSNHPSAGVRTFFWGSNTNPVDPAASPFMAYCDNNLAALWCPDFRWGSYVPQGVVDEPTTTYGYNAAYLAPPPSALRRQSTIIPRPSELFVFADSAMYWAPAGVAILQNSTYLEPVTQTMPGYVQTPTNHFRHPNQRTNALCADGHAQSFTSEGWDVDEETGLGFVGTENDPHYVQD